ncbi:endolytic transglycosylase MltG [Glaciecola sp.]|nr:endolytic transglycosylase MltG [Glaciecola sp.]
MSSHITQRVTIIAVLSALLLVFALLCAWGVNQQHTKVLSLPEDKPVYFAVSSGTNLYQVFDQLTAAGYLSQTDLLRKIWLKTNPQFTQIKAGWYTLSPDMTLLQFVHDIHKGTTTTHQITLVEGQTLWQWLAQMERLDTIELDISFDSDTYTYSDTQGNVWREGYVLPETYQYHHLSKASDILLLAYAAQQEVLATLLKDNSLPPGIHSEHEWLTLASIIEKEAGVAHEREHIAGVFLNRLARRMRLQTDPTVIYGEGPDFNGDITRQNLRAKTPFNTYVIKGLPPTPIAGASKAALASVLSPKITEDLYFVAKGNGEHYFSETLQQHNQAVRQYQLNRSAK